MEVHPIFVLFGMFLCLSGEDFELFVFHKDSGGVSAAGGFVAG